MINTIKHTDFIDTEHLFWGHPELKSIITDEEMHTLCDLELHDWLSGLYWGEGIAMNYAMKMATISPNKEKWLEVYKDEHRHMTLLGNWFMERNLVPLPRNKLINHAFKLVERMDVEMSEEKIVDTIYSTQIFFEELFHSLLKNRTKYIKDRDLKSIFYQIFIDESEHLSKGRSEISEMDFKPKKSYDILFERRGLIFPLSIGCGQLSQEKIAGVEELKEKIVIDMIESARSNVHLYKPIKILHQFQKIPGYNCVACSPMRADGLHLVPVLNETRKTVEDLFTFPKRCEGFNSVVHGGFVGMVLDEMMGYASILKLNLLPLTKSMTVNFKLPVRVGIPYRLVSSIVSQEGQLVVCKAHIEDSNGLVYAESHGQMYVPTKKQAPKILGQLAHHETVQGMFLA